MHQLKTLKWSVHPAPDRPTESAIGLMTLSRPEALNAIDVRMRVELDLLLDQIRRDDRIRVVIITGEGRGFSAGGDLRSEAAPLGALDEEHDFGSFGAYKELANYFFNDLRHVVIQRAIRKLEELEAVTIAAINGTRRWNRARARDGLRHAVCVGPGPPRRSRGTGWVCSGVWGRTQSAKACRRRPSDGNDPHR